MAEKKNSDKKSNAGRKDAWTTIIEPNLEKIKKMYEGGALEKDIIADLQIAPSTYYKYKNEKTELAEIEKDCHALKVDEIKNAMFKRAIGYEYKEKKIYTRKPKGSKNPDDVEFVYMEEYQKHQPPDPTSGLILLKHWDKEGGWTGDPRAMDLKEKQFAVETVKTMNKEFINPDDFGEFEKVLEVLEGNK